MSADWAGFEGQAVNGVWPLMRLLGSSERSAVFLSRTANDPPSSVALKLVPAIAGRAELLLPRWRSAAAIDHPHLLRLFEVGECAIGAQRYLYLVMEYADQNLAQLLEHRALAPDEVREMLGPTLDALEFLHGSKLVHGGLKPSNLLVVGEQIKLASDSIGPVSAARRGSSTTDDVWALGVVTCEALSRRRPAGLQAIAGSIALPPDIPSTFGEMILKCLSRKPEERPDIASLQAWQKGGELEPVASQAPRQEARQEPTQAPRQEPTQAPRQEPTQAPTQTPTQMPTQKPTQMPAQAREQQAAAAAANITHKAAPSSSIRLVIRAEVKPQDEVADSVELKPHWHPMRLIGAVALVLAAVVAGVYFLAPAETPAEANELLVAERGGAEAPRSAAAATAEAAATSGDAQGRATGVPAAQVPATQGPGTEGPGAPAPAIQASAAQGQAAQRQAAQGQAAQAPPPVLATASDSPSTINEVIPTVPRSASQTIRGTVRVSVRVIVDEGGNVVAVTSENPGPSRYFERLSLEAAKKWMFAPADTGGQRLMLVKFNYTRASTTANASPIR